MKSNIFPTLAMVLMLSACGSSKKATVGRDPSMATAVQGTYAGSLPCADCEQIDYRLVLNKDFKYRESLVYQGKSTQPFEKSGSYGFDPSGNVVLDKTDPAMKIFKPESGNLRMLDSKGQFISGDLADKYILKPVIMTEEKPEQNISNINLKKWEEGYEFYGRGNEPFWLFDMDFQKQFRFTTPEGVQLTVPAVEGLRAQDSEVTRYRSVTEGGEVIVTLTAQSCTDNMSGEKFTHRVAVEIKKSSDTGFKKYDGCGRFTIPPVINDIWVLETINGKSFSTSGMPKGAPTLEFHISEGRVAGHGGCNVLGGDFSVMEPGKLRFGNMISTMMACPNMEVETAFSRALSGREMNYVFEGIRLKLTGNDNQTLVFKKVD